jgi:hypothetical protein
LERFLFLANMDISAHTILLADRPQEAIRVTSFRMRREYRSSISFYLLADLGGEGLVYLISCPFLMPPDYVDYALAAVIVLASKFRPRARTLQAMRASLLARAIASTLGCSRFFAASIQSFNPWRSQIFGF